ncbi:MAG: MBL fold metallo-hydrolase [Enterocloster asparagiformis]|nr:MBL fold metallo-hydrolase [Enterocloster asparagiformis]
MRQYPEDRDFTKRLIRPDTWYIHGRPDSAVTYLLIGETKALVIDPGQNRNNIRAYIEQITDKPLVVADTHGHFDHTASNGQFCDCPIYLSEYASRECRNYFPRVNPADYNLEYETIPIPDGFVIDLGGRRVEAVEAGCHSPGSLVFYDDKYRLAFTGDEAECGQVLIHDRKNLGYATVERYRKNLMRLLERCGEIDLICPAHNGAPADGSVIGCLIENCSRILEGYEGKADISSPTYLGQEDPREPESKQALRSNPNYRRSEWKGTAIIYDRNKIFGTGETY